MLEQVFGLVDVVLVMSVDPSFAGQPLIEKLVGKIERLNGVIKAKNFFTMIVFDGAIISKIVKLLFPYIEYFMFGMAVLFIK